VSSLREATINYGQANPEQWFNLSKREKKEKSGQDCGRNCVCDHSKAQLEFASVCGPSFGGSSFGQTRATLVDQQQWSPARLWDKLGQKEISRQGGAICFKIAPK